MKYLSQVVKGNLIEKEKGKVKVFDLLNIFTRYNGKGRCEFGYEEIVKHLQLL